MLSFKFLIVSNAALASELLKLGKVSLKLSLKEYKTSNDEHTLVSKSEL